MKRRFDRMLVLFGALALALPRAAGAEPAAASTVSELEVDFQLFVQQHQSPARADATPALLPELAAFAKRFHDAGDGYGEARVLGWAAVVEVRAGRLPDAAKTLARAVAAAPPSERPLRAQLAVMQGRLAEIDRRYAEAVRNYRSALVLGARKTAPASQNNPSALTQTGADFMLGLTGALMQSQTSLSADYQKKYAGLMMRARTGTPDERQRAGEELRALSAEAAREAERRKARVILETLKQRKKDADWGFDPALTAALKSVFCTQDASQGLSPNWSLEASTDRMLSGYAGGDVGKLRAQSEPDVVLAGFAPLTTPAREGETPNDFGKALGACLQPLSTNVMLGFLRRLSDPLEPDSYFAKLTADLGKLEATTGTELYLAPAHLTLAERKRRRGEVAPARADFQAALKAFYKRPEQIDPRRLGALHSLASLRFAEDRALIAGYLAVEETVLAKRAASWPAGNLSDPKNVWGELQKYGIQQPRAKAAAPGDTSTLNVLLQQSAQFSSLLTDFAQASDRVVAPLGVARIHDTIGDTDSADRVRAGVVRSVESALATSPIARDALDAVLHADLAERDERAGRAADARRAAVLSAQGWARLVRSTQLVAFEQGFASSRPPRAVFEQAVRAALAGGDAAAAFELAELARSAAAPRRVRSAAAAPNTSALEKKLWDAEERAIKDASPGARARLTAAVARARTDSKPRTALVSPLAAAGARVDALRGHAPRGELDALDAELVAFEDAYQRAGSQALEASTVQRAAQRIEGAEARIRETGDATGFGDRQRARDELAAARAASRVSSPLTFRSFVRAAELQAPLGAQKSLLAYWFGTESLYAFVVGKAGVTGVAIPGVTAPAVELAVRRARSGDLANLQASYDELVAPIRKAISGNELVIVPDGPIGYLPLEALHDGSRHLFQHFAVQRAAYASDILAPRNAAVPVTRAFAGAALAVAGYPELTHAAEELDDLARNLPTVDVKTNRALTKNALLGALPGSDLVHVAAHGEPSSNEPIFSRLYLAGSDSRPGTLEAREIEGLRLSELQLVVLSACATAGVAPPAAGRATAGANAGDDIASLSDAFVSAGANSVVATLWSVDDSATAAFMKPFYAALARGASKPAALDAGRQAMLSDPVLSSPRYWAAFVLAGNPAPLTFPTRKLPTSQNR